MTRTTEQNSSYGGCDPGRRSVKSIASGKPLISRIGIGKGFVILIAVLALACIVQLVLADDYYVQITTANGTSGVVNGGLYVKALQPVPFADQGIGTSHTIVANFTLPATPSSVKWARLYEVWYSGSGVNNYGVNATTQFNGNGNYVTLGNELLATQSGVDGHYFPVNDHVSKVFSDYDVWYNVTSYISRGNPSVVLHDEAVPGYPYVDGRLKAVALVVAYNVSRGSPGTVYYWVNQGQEWLNGTVAEGGVYPYLDNDNATFDTSALAGQTTSSATLTELSTSSKDATYKFNGNTLTNGTLPGDFNYYENHTWAVYNGSAIASSSVFNFKNSTETGSYNAGSYQIQLATLSILK